MLKKRVEAVVGRFRFERYLLNKYNYFFLSILFMIAADPYIDTPHLPLISFVFLTIMLTLLWALGLSRRLMWLCLFLAFIASPVGFLCDSRTFAAGSAASFWSGLLSLSAYMLFMLIVIKVLLWKIFAEKVVTADTIRGGISIYFLMGIFWSFAYALALLIDASAVSFPAGTHHHSDLLYFSFVTMTTLGYGDISPVSGATRSMAILEASLGQVFITVFIARLVGLHLRAGARSGAE